MKTNMKRTSVRKNNKNSIWFKQWCTLIQLCFCGLFVWQTCFVCVFDFKMCYYFSLIKTEWIQWTLQTFYERWTKYSGSVSELLSWLLGIEPNNLWKLKTKCEIAGCRYFNSKWLWSSLNSFPSPAHKVVRWGKQNKCLYSVKLVLLS